LGLFEKRSLKISVIFILAVSGIARAVADGILAGSVLLVMLGAGLAAVDSYWFYLRYYRNRGKPRGPLSPPGGKPDVYFPRSDIPRPLYEDMRRMKGEANCGQADNHCLRPF
jgi:hypothetical protein